MTDHERTKRSQYAGLMSEQFIAVYPSLAERAGINEAAILQRVHWKVQSVQEAKYEDNHFAGKDGVTRWWYRATYDDWRRDHFTWLSKGTVQRLFLKLEAEGILLSWTPKDNNQEKYYTIRYEAWEYWMAGRQIRPITKCGGWWTLDPSQNEVGAITKWGEGDHNLWLGPITNYGGYSIYKDSKESDIKNNQSSSESAHHPAGVEQGSVRADEEDEIETTILLDEAVVLDSDKHNPVTQTLATLGVPPEKREQLLALGAERALALVWQAQKNTNRSSPVGLLLTMLNRQQQPPDFLIQLAKEALAAGITDHTAAERAHRTRMWQATESEMSTTPATESPPAMPKEGVPRPQGDDPPPAIAGDPLPVKRSELLAFVGHYYGHPAWETLQQAELKFQEGILSIRAQGSASLESCREAIQGFVSRSAHQRIQVVLEGVSA